MNLLKFESSPYLLQHANNPVHWLAWNDKSLQKAKDENKIILVSIGYSACHWCHVMEHECFENEFLAKVMNEHFICIKVDREERPDLDNIYMNAVQLMTGKGGWPLNCFTLPDGSPIYGGTYFNSEQWYNILLNLAEAWRDNKQQTIEYAEKLKKGMQVSNEHFILPEKKNNMKVVEEALTHWRRRFDTIYGGPNKAPKFPLPCNYIFLQHYGMLTTDIEVSEHVNLTLLRMLGGGIYDQVEGGFARYSVDSMWKVPHFEKMLYDNAQLIELYSEAYRFMKHEPYQRIAQETINFVVRNWKMPSGLYASAYDADSEGVEGKYYVMTEAEMNEIIAHHHWQEHAERIKNYFGINATGFWEHDVHVLHACTKEPLSDVQEWKQALLEFRSKRIKPSLDDKQLCSWNALLCSAFCEASKSLQSDNYKQLAVELYAAIKQHFNSEDSHLYRTHKNGKSSIGGFLEDYAACIRAAIQLFELSSENGYLTDALAWIKICEQEFTNAEGSLFYFTSVNQSDILFRQTDLQDNVIPSSNSMMAENVYRLGNLLGNENYLSRAHKMCEYAVAQIGTYPEAYGNWCKLMMWMDRGISEIVVCGKDAFAYKQELEKELLPSYLVYASETENEASVFKNRYEEGKTNFYLCKNQTCSIPISNYDQFVKEHLSR